MKTSRITLCLLLIIITTFIATAHANPAHLPVRPSGSADTTLPEGLTAEDWASIQAQMRQADYQIVRHETDETYRALNPEHGWRAEFTTTGLRIVPRQQEETWSWEMRLTRYGYEGHLQTVVGTPVRTMEAVRGGH